MEKPWEEKLAESRGEARKSMDSDRPDADEIEAAGESMEKNDEVFAGGDETPEVKEK